MQLSGSSQLQQHLQQGLTTTEHSLALVKMVSVQAQ